MPLGRRIAIAIAVIGGGRADGLAQVPGATGGFIGMAFVLAFTSIVAGLSAATALTMALHARLWVAAVLGVFWGLLIFNLDRLLIVTLSKNSSKTFRITGIAFRIFLAACLAIIISTPVTLLIFQKEISRELAIQQTAQVSAYQAQQATLTSGKHLAQYEKELNADQSRLSAGNFDTPSDAQRVANDEEKEQQDHRTYLKQQTLTEGEANGTAGSHHVGCAQICMLDEEQESQDLTQYKADVQQTHVDLATEAADAAQEKQRVESDVTTVTDEIDAIKNAQASSLSSYAKTTANSVGLLARIEALWALGSTNLTARLTHLFLFILFFIIEILPVTMKAFQVFGEKNHYEHAIDRIDQTGLDLHHERMDVLMETAKQQKHAQLDAAQALNEQILNAQKQVFQQHLDNWVRNATSGNGAPGTSTPPGTS